VRQHRQGLPLGLEACDHLLRVHPQLDDFERDDPADGLALLGPVDGPHPPFADRFEDAKGADPLGTLVGAAGPGGLIQRRVDGLLRLRKGVLRT